MTVNNSSTSDQAKQSGAELSETTPAGDASRTDSWPNTYQPTTLSEMALSEDIRELAEVLMRRPNLTHDLLLVGPPGTGKTSLAKVIVSTMIREFRRERVLDLSAVQAG